MTTNNCCFNCNYYSGQTDLSCAIQPWSFPDSCSEWESGPCKPPMWSGVWANPEPPIQWEVLGDYPQHGWAKAVPLPLKQLVLYHFDPCVDWEVQSSYPEYGWDIAWDAPLDENEFGLYVYVSYPEYGWACAEPLPR